MSSKKKDAYAVELFRSLRGQLILTQALTVAIETMKQAQYPEQSNIEDMEIFKERLFTFFSP
jgi:type III secretory pathway lipoprotein EscJ